MKKEEVLGILQDNGFVLDEEKVIPYGVQFSFRNGSKVSVFDKGTVTPQGQHIDRVKELLGLAVPSGAPSATATTVAVRKKVFVVYGHEPDSRAQLEAMLRRWDLEPLILDQLPSEGQTIIEKLEKHTSEANFCVVLATPDDIGFRAGHEDEKEKWLRLSEQHSPIYKWHSGGLEVHRCPWCYRATRGALRISFYAASASFGSQSR